LLLDRKEAFVFSATCTVESSILRVRSRSVCVTVYVVAKPKDFMYYSLVRSLVPVYVYAENTSHLGVVSVYKKKVIRRGEREYINTSTLL
jgi:hypothetical protein